MTNLTGGRPGPTNYLQICENLADQYPTGTPHGVQKDAIQNAVDACRGKGPVQVDFAVVQNSKGSFLCITDSGTTGLTGPVLTRTDEYERDIPTDYRWARFESLAFQNSDPDALGARGQGKFIFLHASKEHTMFYDTLRDDGVYRVGASQATRTEWPIYPGPGEEPWEGERGAWKLAEHCGLTPLAVPGTRVVIVEPTDELRLLLALGHFARAIQETWFRAIEKRRLIARVMVGERPLTVDLPHPYPLPESDTADHKTWILGKDFRDDEIRVSSGERYGVKHFHAIYLNKGTVCEEMRGIAIIQNCMKIESLEMTIAPPQVRERVTGYIEFDTDLDRELRKGENQSPSHYSLRWKRRLPQAIKQYINAQLEDFGKRKLGLKPDPREVKSGRRADAEEWAMRQLMTHAKDLDLFGSKRRGRGVNPPPPPPPPPKPIGISINNFDLAFPDLDVRPRVNWDQVLKGLGVSVYNRTGAPREVYARCALLHGDTEIGRLVADEKVLLSDDMVSFGPFDLVIDKTRFVEPGEYRVKATLLDAQTGDRVDDVARRFWVEVDPPRRWPFEPIAANFDTFPEEHRRRQWKTHGSIDQSPSLYYNTSHPAYRRVEGDDEAQRDYLLQVFLEGAVQFVLYRPDGIADRADFHPLDSDRILGPRQREASEDIPNKTYDEVMRYLSAVRWKICEED